MSTDSKKMVVLVVFFSAFCLLVEKISGHGMMLEPPNRSSLWRFDSSAPANEKDNEVWCGGIPIQWGENDGNCGVCGDPWNVAHPQPNENTGTYGEGKIVRTYSPGSIVDIEINVTLNHMGSFDYSLCVLEDLNGPETGEDCFQALELADGQTKYTIDTTDKVFTVNNQIKLPEGLTCERCVLRWNYLTDPIVEELTETFRSCADIAIL